MHFFIVLVLSYLLGSIPFGKIIGYLKGLDIQKEGSGNIGFANSFRVLGWRPAIFVLVGDILKGFIPVYYALYHFSLNYVLIVGLAVIIGHIAPPWLKFNGGKGVATMVGVSLALNPSIALTAIMIWVIVFLFDKTASVSSLAITILMPILSIFLEPELFYFYLLLVVIIFFTHRTNITDLLKGKETKII